MKGLILAGGTGTRLRPLTHTHAKQLVPVANKPILFYAIEHLVAVGITDIAIVIGETGDAIRAAVGDGSRWGAAVTYLPQDQPLGLAHAVGIARSFLGDDDFVMYLGDNLLQHGLASLVERSTTDRQAATPSLDHQPTMPAAHVLLSEVRDPQRFGVAEIRDGRIVALEEKPTVPRSNLAMVGAYLFTPAIHEAVAAIPPSARGELEIVDAIQWLIDHGHAVHHDLLDGWWLDTGKKDSLLEANRRVLETIEPRIDGVVDVRSEIDGRVVVEEGATISGSTIRGPAIIGAGAEVRDSYVGPFTSIGEHTTIVDTEIEGSVLLDRLCVVGVRRLVDSLIGSGTEVTHSGRAPRGTQLLVGNDCRVDVP